MVFAPLVTTEPPIFAYAKLDGKDRLVIDVYLIGHVRPEEHVRRLTPVFALTTFLFAPTPVSIHKLDFQG